MDQDHELCQHLLAEERAVWVAQLTAAVERAALLGTRLSVATATIERLNKEAKPNASSE